MNIEDKKIKIVISEMIEGVPLEEPPQCFLELYKLTQQPLEEIKKEWNVLIRFKNNTEELLIYEIETFLEFTKSIIGRSFNDNLVAEIEMHLDRLNELGIEINLTVPNTMPNNKDWDYIENKWKRVYKSYMRKVNNSKSVVWTVQTLHTLFDDKFDKIGYKTKKKDLIDALNQLRKEGYILEYLEKDIYCGEPAYKKRWYNDYEFGWTSYYELIPPKKAQGNSYQKYKKPFRVCLGEKLKNQDYWDDIDMIWHIDEQKWRDENGY